MAKNGVPANVFTDLETAAMPVAAAVVPVRPGQVPPVD